MDWLQVKSIEVPNLCHTVNIWQRHFLCFLYFRLQQLQYISHFSKLLKCEKTNVKTNLTDEMHFPAADMHPSHFSILLKMNMTWSQVSISPTFYTQLLRVQIPKVQKDSQVMQLFALLVPARLKAVHKHVDDLKPGVNFTNILREAFLYKSVMHSFSPLIVHVCTFLEK